MYLRHVKSWLFVMFTLIPTMVWAGQVLDNKFGQDELINDRFIIMMIALSSFFGSIGATFIKTDADEFVRYPVLAKIIIGSFFGTFAGLGLFKYYGLNVYLLLAPVFIISSLGSAILVFYMRYLSDPRTKSKLIQKVEQKLGLDQEEK